MKRPREWPWSALLDQLARPLGGTDAAGTEWNGDDLLAGIEGAWEEVAGRLGLTRLGWLEGRPDGELRITLAFPCRRAVARWRAIAAAPGPGAGSEGLYLSPTEHIACVVRDGGMLVAGAAPSALPSRPALGQIGALAEALVKRLDDKRLHRAALDRARGARRIGAAAHDLRNELTRAMLLVERDGAQDRAELIRALRGARDLAHGALSGRGPGAAPALAEVHLRTLLTEACSAAAAAARGAGSAGATPPIRLRCPKALTALANAGSLDRALRNVIVNAVEATVRRGGGGDVRVEARRDAPFDDVHPEAGFDLCIAITDSGAGMPPGELAHFLHPRAASDRGAVGDELESTGLGTASLQLALEIGGIPLQVQSAPGRGTTVTLRLRSARPREVIVDPDIRRGRRRARAIRGAVHVVSDDAARRLLCT